MTMVGSSPAGMIAVGDLPVQRLGFGAMRISVARDAAGVRDPAMGRALVRHAVDRGVTFLDTANIYGLGRSEELIAAGSLGALLELRESEPLLEMCERHGVAFIPWQPLVRDQVRLRMAEEIARAHRATAQQVVLAWLLHRSPVMLPIPGTTSLAHLDANIDAAWIELTDDEFARLGADAP